MGLKRNTIEVSDDQGLGWFSRFLVRLGWGGGHWSPGLGSHWPTRGFSLSLDKRQQLDVVVRISSIVGVQAPLCGRQCSRNVEVDATYVVDRAAVQHGGELTLGPAADVSGGGWKGRKDVRRCVWKGKELLPNE